ncbi:hypothetical protein RDI58_017887 [Solanum bulbocastanum]|uniref:Uncharacterized protein n=1 Tax=Solanum bulbocastanum TaxID=147425 RepID=A0AAN8TGA0_SOLBU
MDAFLEEKDIDPKVEVTARYRHLCHTFVQISSEASESKEGYELVVRGANEMIAKLKDIKKRKESPDKSAPSNTTQNEPSEIVFIDNTNFTKLYCWMDAVKYKRNKSLTKEEIEAFWRSNKHREEVEVTNSASSQTQIHDHQANDETTNSNDDYEENLIKKHGWWVSSSLAHLNEPPVLPPQEPTTYKCVSLFKQTG